MPNIILVGYRGAGKSSVAKELSRRLEIPVISIDKEIEKRVGAPLIEYISKKGWKDFRKVESEAVRKVETENSIIDCGGGVIESKKNINHLRKLGRIIWLKASSEVIKSRIKDSKMRPSLQEENIIDEVDKVIKRRNPIYKSASDIEINTDNKSIEEVSKRIIKELDSRTKICIPIIAKKVSNALNDLKAARKRCDIVELRIDFIKDIDENKLKTLLKGAKKDIIISCRKENDKGKFNGKEQERIHLLRTAINLSAGYIDIEYDAGEKIIKDLIRNKKDTKIIISYHNFKYTPKTEELERIYYKIKELNPDLVKIVTFAGSLNDNFRVFELLRGKKDLISFCMGIKGQISRVICAKYGSLLTYASIEKNKGSASGQITAEELIKEYNFYMLDKNTKILGVIGEHAENSKSRFMHNSMFKIKGFNAVYHPFKLESHELEEFIKRFKEDYFIGAAVTVPHKVTIMKYLDRIDETAKKIGAVNTIVNKNKELVGYNTDYYGAVMALKEKTELKGKRVLVIGAGGAARAVIYGLRKEGCELTIVNRTIERAKMLAEEFNVKFDDIIFLTQIIHDNEIIINTTSVGMKPNEKESVIEEKQIASGKIMMDIVYSPIKTKLIKLAQNKGCKTITGERMLIYQAIKQFELWTGKKAEFKVMEKALLNQIKQIKGN